MLQFIEELLVITILLPAAGSSAGHGITPHTTTTKNMKMFPDGAVATAFAGMPVVSQSGIYDIAITDFGQEAVVWEAFCANPGFGFLEMCLSSDDQTPVSADCDTADCVVRLDFVDDATAAAENVKKEKASHHAFPKNHAASVSFNHNGTIWADGIVTGHCRRSPLPKTGHMTAIIHMPEEGMCRIVLRHGKIVQPTAERRADDSVINFIVAIVFALGLFMVTAVLLTRRTFLLPASRIKRRRSVVKPKTVKQLAKVIDRGRKLSNVAEVTVAQPTETVKVATVSPLPTVSVPVPVCDPVDVPDEPTTAEISDTSIDGDWKEVKSRRRTRRERPSQESGVESGSTPSVSPSQTSDDSVSTCASISYADIIAVKAPPRSGSVSPADSCFSTASIEPTSAGSPSASSIIASPPPGFENVTPVSPVRQIEPVLEIPKIPSLIELPIRPSSPAYFSCFDIRQVYDRYTMSPIESVVFKQPSFIELYRALRSLIPYLDERLLLQGVKFGSEIDGYCKGTVIVSPEVHDRVHATQCALVCQRLYALEYPSSLIINPDSLAQMSSTPICTLYAALVKDVLPDAIGYKILLYILCYAAKFRKRHQQAISNQQHPIPLIVSIHKQGYPLLNSDFLRLPPLP